jgi:1-deoxy-D-xylulose-5-phosphate synthase
LQNILYTAQLGLKQPIAIRYPRGRGNFPDWATKYFGNYTPIAIGAAHCLREGHTIAVLSAGTIGNNVTDALINLSENTIAHYDFPFVKPLDEKSLHAIFSKYTEIITIEDGTVVGGFGSAIATFAAQYHYNASVQIMGVPDKFIEHGTVFELQQYCKIDVKSLELFFSTKRK